MLDASSVPAGPVWESITHDVLCPLCGYNLRGLTDPRCPECGYRFEWAVVTDPTARLHPYLFEHHPERNVRSFLQTHWGTLRPIRFWSSLSPTQPSRPKRLVIYGFFSSLLMLLALVGEWVWATVYEGDYIGNSLVFFRGRFVGTRPGNPPSWDTWWRMASDALRDSRGFKVILYLTIFWLIWPWLTLVTLSIFRVSMRRAKVKTIHVMRCLVYTFDVGAWLGLVLGTAAVISVWIPSITLVPRSDVSPILIGVVVLLVFVRLWMAYRLYLRFDHAFWTILASQVIVFLLALNFFLDLERLMFLRF
jgi:rubredoxin